MKLFHQRNIVIATMHEKEAVIAPLLEKNFKMKCTVPTQLNTDLLGTFSGERERKDSPIAAALKKCNLAMDEIGYDLAIASEGSFGAHPYSFFSRADEEIVVLLDRKNKIEIVGKALSTNTNFDGKVIKSLLEGLDFAKQVHFPSHGLIIKDKKEAPTVIYKGIINPLLYEELIDNTLHTHGQVWVETDMRALFNPTRLKIIEQATANLIEKMKSHCPACKTPGYWVVDHKTGLPCDLCHSPTKSTLAHLYGCLKCDYKNEVKFPNKKTVEDPSFCDYCNP